MKMASTSRASRRKLNLYKKELENTASENEGDSDSEFLNLEQKVDDSENITILTLGKFSTNDSDDAETGTYFMDQEGKYYTQSSKNCLERITTTPTAGARIISINMPTKSQVKNHVEIEKVDRIHTRSSRKQELTAIAKQKENELKKESGSVEYLFVLKNNNCQKDEAMENDEEPPANDQDEKEVLNAGEKGNTIRTYCSKDNVNKQKLVRVRVNNKSVSNFEEKGVIYACTYCEYATYKRFLLSRHLQGHSDERPFQCSVCERGFKTKVALVNHVNVHLGNKPHKCAHCAKAFTTAGELVRHMRYKHTGEKPHKCTECEYESVEMSKLRRHMRCHTGERPYQCPHCTYASPDSFKLKRHLRTHTGEKPYECDICHARFTQSNSLKSHRLIHSVGDKPVFQCEFCPTTCGRKTDLRAHINNLHTSDKPIPCKRCGQQLPDRYTYKMHVKTHEGEKCYSCSICPYATSCQRHLSAHMLIHSDEKPFVCNQCDQAFRQPSLLKRHINLYHTLNYVPPKPRQKVHECPHCKRLFTHNGNLMRHMAIHDPEPKLQNKNKGRRLRNKAIHKDPTSTVSQAMDLLLSDEKDLEDEDAQRNNSENEIIFVTDFEFMDEDEYITGDKAFDRIETDNSDDKVPEIKSVTIKKESNGKEFMTVEVGDNSEFMMVEVINCDGNEDDDDDLNDLECSNTTLNINRDDDKSSNEIELSTCFNFEEDEIDIDETKGNIQVLDFIEDY